MARAGGDAAAADGEDAFAPTKMDDCLRQESFLDGDGVGDNADQFPRDANTN